MSLLKELFDHFLKQDPAVEAAIIAVQDAETAVDRADTYYKEMLAQTVRRAGEVVTIEGLQAEKLARNAEEDALQSLEAAMDFEACSREQLTLAKEKALQNKTHLKDVIAGAIYFLSHNSLREEIPTETYDSWKHYTLEHWSEFDKIQGMSVFGFLKFTLLPNFNGLDEDEDTALFHLFFKLVHSLMSFCADADHAIILSDELAWKYNQYLDIARLYKEELLGDTFQIAPGVNIFDQTDFIDRVLVVGAVMPSVDADGDLDLGEDEEDEEDDSNSNSNSNSVTAVAPPPSPANAGAGAPPGQVLPAPVVPPDHLRLSPPIFTLHALHTPYRSRSQWDDSRPGVMGGSAGSDYCADDES